MYDAEPVLATLPETFTRTAAHRAGLTDRVIERLIRHRRVVRVQPGVLRRSRSVAGHPEWQATRGDHLVRAQAALLAHPHHALSHVTAALARGWPVSLRPGDLVHLTAVTVQPRSRRVADRFLHHSDSMINDVEEVDGLPVLGAARTVADCLRTCKPPLGVASADGAVRSGATRLDEIRTVLACQRGWFGRPQASRAVDLIDPRRESWLESVSFVRLWQRGIELPTPQVEVFDDTGRFVARVDGMWIADATVAEADGHGKYVTPAPGEQVPHISTVDRVLAERSRERALLDLGLEVVRWDSHEIWNDLDGIAGRVHLARRRGDLRRFRGRLRT